MSVTMKDELAALQKIKSWNIQGFEVVDAYSVTVETSSGKEMAMAIKWIDGDFFDIAKIPQDAAALILLIAARTPNEKKVNTSEMGMTKWATNLQSKNATTWGNIVVKKKLQMMYLSLSAIQEVEGSIVDLQVMVQDTGYMVIIDPLGVGKLRGPSNKLGGNLMAPNFSSGEHVANKFVENAEKWALNRGAQTKNIDEAVEALRTTIATGAPPNQRKTARQRRQQGGPGASLMPP